VFKKGESPSFLSSPSQIKDNTRMRGTAVLRGGLRGVR
jgi:hypothetical protein